MYLANMYINKRKYKTVALMQKKNKSQYTTWQSTNARQSSRRWGVFRRLRKTPGKGREEDPENGDSRAGQLARVHKRP